MDYREVQNRFQRHRDMIKERAYDRLIEEAQKAHQSQAQPTNRFARLQTFLTAILQRKAKPQPDVNCPQDNGVIIHQEG